MIGFALANWKLLGGLVAGVLLAGYVGVLNLQLATERATVAALDRDLSDALGKAATCNARLNNILEARESDATIPDDLYDFVVPPEWMRRPPGN